MNDTGTIAAIASLLVLVLGAIGLLMSRQMKAVSGLLTAARGDPPADDDGPVARTGRHQAIQPTPDPVLAALTDLGRRVDDLGKKVDGMGEKIGETLMSHAQRITRVEARVPRRKNDEADSDRPGR